VELESGSHDTDGRCRLRQPRNTRRRAVREAMSLEELERWIEQLNPPPLIDGVSMLDGSLTATIIGPCFIDPHEWLHHMLGPHSGLGMEGSEQAAAIMAVVTRFNAISNGLATAPERYAPIFGRTDDGTVLAGPWCMGFLAAIKFRHDAWRPLHDVNRMEHRLLLSILLHCTDAAGRPLRGPVWPGPEGEEFLRTAYHDIARVVPVIRESWMPDRARSWSA
jgi:uncharacterized protein